MNSRKHELLFKVTSSLNDSVPEEAIEILGHSYILRVLKPEGEDWANQHTVGNTVAAVIYNGRLPQLAASLASIDGIPIEQLWTPDGEMKEALLADVKALRDWRRLEIMSWLREECDSILINSLFEAFTGMNLKHKKALEGIESLSRRTL